MSIGKSSRARGANRGGTGGGWELTDPDWDIKRIQRLRAEYDSLDPYYQTIYLESLNKFDKYHVLNREPR
jgi:hypothetical protein